MLPIKHQKNLHLYLIMDNINKRKRMKNPIFLSTTYDDQIDKCNKYITISHFKHNKFSYDTITHAKYKKIRRHRFWEN